MTQNAPEMYVHHRIAARLAEVVARFEHPLTDVPMVTWYQTNPVSTEESAFYSASEKEFRTVFEPLGGS